MAGKRVKQFIGVAFSCLVSVTAWSAEFHSIVPGVGSVWGIGGLHVALATVTNPTSRTALVERRGLYPAFAPEVCDWPESWSVPPRSSISISSPCSSSLFSLELVADEPVHVSVIVTSLPPGTYGFDHQLFEAPTSWFRPGHEVILPARIEREFRWRSNLVIINPGDEAIVVQMHIERAEFSSSRLEEIVVPAQRTLIYPIAQVEDPGPPSPWPRILTGDHDLRLESTGPFWAGVSAVDFTGGNLFFKGIELEP